MVVVLRNLPLWSWRDRSCSYPVSWRHLIDIVLSSVSRSSSLLPGSASTRLFCLGRGRRRCMDSKGRPLRRRRGWLGRGRRQRWWVPHSWAAVNSHLWFSTWMCVVCSRSHWFTRSSNNRSRRSSRRSGRTYSSASSRSWRYVSSSRLWVEWERLAKEQASQIWPCELSDGWCRTHWHCPHVAQRCRKSSRWGSQTHRSRWTQYCSPSSNEHATYPHWQGRPVSSMVSALVALDSQLSTSNSSVPLDHYCQLATKLHRYQFKL